MKAKLKERGRKGPIRRTTTTTTIFSLCMGRQLVCHWFVNYHLRVFMYHEFRRPLPFGFPLFHFISYYFNFFFFGSKYRVARDRLQKKKKKKKKSKFFFRFLKILFQPKGVLPRNHYSGEVIKYGFKLLKTLFSFCISFFVVFFF